MAYHEESLEVTTDSYKKNKISELRKKISSSKGRLKSSKLLQNIHKINKTLKIANQQLELASTFFSKKCQLIKRTGSISWIKKRIERHKSNSKR